jgi:hypothetical protein
VLPDERQRLAAQLGGLGADSLEACTLVFSQPEGALELNQRCL